MTALVRRPRDASRTGRWCIAALLVVTTASVVSCGRSGGDPPATQPESTASSTPTQSADSEPPAFGPDDAVRTVVISDEAPSTLAWPDLLARVLGDAGIPMSVATTARDGAGFGSSPSFADLVAGTAEGSTQLVVLVDSRLAGTDRLSELAEDTFTEVERAAPDAMLVVVGPLPAEDAAASASASAPASAELAAATQHAGGTYVDPRAEGWPTDVTQSQLAELLRLHLQPLVEVLAASGANR